MATAGGPNTIEDGLVLYLDTGNEKSYKGEPTVNLVPNQSLTWGEYNTSITQNSTTAPDGTLTGIKITATATTQVRTEFNLTNPAAATYYTVSIFAKRGSTPYAGFFTYFDPYTSPYAIFNLDTGTLASSSGTYSTSIKYEKDGWYRISMTVYVRTDQTYRLIKVIQTSSTDPSGGVTGNYVYYWKPQVEAKSHVTPHTTDTRSATQGLVSLIGTGSVDLSNVSFDSSAKKVFDGTDDYISIPSKSFTINQPWSFSLFVKTNTAISSAWKNLIGATGDTDCMWMMHPAGFALYQAYYSSQTYIWWSGIDATNMPVGTWNDVTITCTPVSSTVTNFTSYLNGIQKNKSDFTWAPINNTQVFTRIGGNGDRYFHGEVPVARIFNKALTAQEVRQNYNALKGRFGL